MRYAINRCRFVYLLGSYRDFERFRVPPRKAYDTHFTVEDWSQNICTMSSWYFWCVDGIAWLKSFWDKWITKWTSSREGAHMRQSEIPSARGVHICSVIFKAWWCKIEVLTFNDLRTLYRSHYGKNPRSRRGTLWTGRERNIIKQLKKVYVTKNEICSQIWREHRRYSGMKLLRSREIINVTLRRDL